MNFAKNLITLYGAIFKSLRRNSLLDVYGRLHYMTERFLD